MAINYQLLTYRKITDPVQLGAASRSDNHDINERDAFNSLDIIEGNNFINIAPKNRRSSYHSLGKFHLSVADEDIGKAWDAVVHLIAEAKVGTKVITPEGLSVIHDNLSGAKGKNIVIYFDQEQAQDKEKFQTLLTKIERAFEESDVRPGAAINDEKKVSGSQYAYMRYGDTEYDSSTGQALPIDKRDKSRRTPLNNIVIPPGRWQSRIADASSKAGRTSP